MRCCLLLFPRFVHLAPIKLVRRRAYEPAERIRSPHAASRHVVGDKRRRLARGFCDRPGALVPRAVPEARLEAFRALRTGDAVECREQAAWDDEEGVAHAVLGVAGARGEDQVSREAQAHDKGGGIEKMTPTLKAGLSN